PFKARGEPEVPLLPDVEPVIALPGRLLEPEEERRRLAHELELVELVELQTKRAGRDRSGERAEPRPRLDDQGADPGARRVQRGRGADDAAPDDHEIRGRWRLGQVPDHRPIEDNTSPAARSPDPMAPSR